MLLKKTTKVCDDIYQVLSRPKTCLNIKTKEHIELIKQALIYNHLGENINIHTINNILAYNEFSCIELFTDNINNKRLVFAPRFVYQRQDYDIIDIDSILIQNPNTNIKFKNKVRVLQWN